MNIGVNGASGQLGKAVVTHLQTRAGNERIVGISRTPETLPQSIEGRYGDYNSPETLVLAYENLDKLLIIPSSDMRPGVRETHFIAAIEAAALAGVKHIVLISSAATKKAKPSEMNAAYWVGEQHLMKSAPEWTILRMNYYAETFAQMAPMLAASGAVPGLAENRVAFVSRNDLAAAAAGILLSEGHHGAIYNATGPKAISGPERAALVAEYSGAAVQFVVMKEAQLRSGMAQTGIPPEYIDAMIDIEKHFASGSYDIVTGDVERLSGSMPKPLTVVLADAEHIGRD